MMRTLLLLVPLLGAVRSDGECNGVRKEYDQCTMQAHKTFITAMKRVRQGDGRPNFAARKTCNYMMEAIEDCGNVLLQHGCNSEERVMANKDAQLGRVLGNIESIIADWDSCKCPPIKAHIDRMKAKEGATVSDCPSDYSVIHESEFTSQFMDFDFAFIGGVIVATGIVLAKPFVIAFF